MARLIAKLLCLAIGGVAGWAVYSNLADLLDNWIPYVGAGLTVIAVFIMLYFPLLRPISDLISEKLMVLKEDTRYLRSGTGIGDIPSLDDPKDQPVAVPTQPCAVCGSPSTTPVCENCLKKMSR